MRITKGALYGSTLVETLVMMLVAGVVFLTVMDGMTLFSRLQTRRFEELLSAGRERDGYFRLVALFATADSVCENATGLEVYQGGRSALLECRDSTLIYRAGTFEDTLLTGIARMRLVQQSAQPDTVAIGFRRGYTVKFPVLSPMRKYRVKLDEIEKDYGYEE